MQSSRILYSHLINAQTAFITRHFYALLSPDVQTVAEVHLVDYVAVAVDHLLLFEVVPDNESPAPESAESFS